MIYYMKKYKSPKKDKNTYRNIFKYAAVSSAGAFIGLIPQLIIGTIILLLGIYLVNMEKNNNDNDKKDIIYYIGIIMILIGGAVSLNLFISTDIIMGFLDD